MLIELKQRKKVIKRHDEINRYTYTQNGEIEKERKKERERQERRKRESVKE